MQVGLLGPLEVAGPGGRVRIGGAKERLVLALLILRAGEVVARDALVDAVWGEAPPATAVKTLQGYVARVRRALEANGMADVLETRAPGYRLQVPTGSVDVAAFERHAAAGHRALVAGDAARAATELRGALELWRGDALVDCRGSGWAEAEAVRLDERRVSTVEDRVDADLMLGHHGALVGELESLVAQHPLRERLWAALMLALYRSDRQADAVRAYQRARTVLVGELGIEPGSELRRLEAAVLAGDATLDAPEAATSAPASIGVEAGLAVPLPMRVGGAASRVFVGRTRERDVLRASLAEAAAGDRHVVLISGEPGIGKTALSFAAALEAFADGHAVLYGRCDEDLGIPYQPWASLLAHLVGHAPAHLLAAHVDARGTELGRLVGDLAGPLVGRSWSSDGETERYLLFGAVVDLLGRASALAPIVLVLDDLQWADRPTIQLLRHLVSADASLRVLVIGTFRDSDVGRDHPLVEMLAALHRESGIDRVILHGLDGDEVRDLLGATADDARDQGIVLRDALLAETDGNPFFVGEMLRHLSETGAVGVDERGRWVAQQDLRTVGLPVSIREVIGRRVARLGVPARDVLSLAAVIGRDFDAELLARVADVDEAPIIDLCDQAVEAALLSPGDSADCYTFVHALIEHALYDDLSAGKRSRTHRAVAEALETLCGDDPAERIGELAYHWARTNQARDEDKAITYARLAGDRALVQLAPDEALRWYRAALDRLDGATTDDPRRRAGLLLGLGDAQRQTGDPQHRETLLAAGSLADHVDAIDILVRAALRNNRGWNSIVGGVDHERIAMLRRALARLGDADCPDRARLLAVLSAETTWDTEFDDRLWMATEAVAIARRTGDDTALVDAIRLCHESITMPHTLELRQRWNAEACELADGLGDSTARLHANDWRWLAALEAGDITTMRAARAIFGSESERIGLPQNRWQIEYHWAVQHAIAGDLDASERSATEALELGGSAGHGEDAFRFHRMQLLTVRWMQGRIAEARALVPQGAHDRPGNQVFRAALAFTASYDADASEVHRLLDAAVVDGFSMHPDAVWLVAHVLWADAAARSGHREAAAGLYQRLLPWHEQFATTHISVHGSVAHYLGVLTHSLDRRDEAEHWFVRAQAFHEMMDAPFFVALTQTAWASLLADQSGAGDIRRARALIDTALPAATDRGYRQIAGDARRVGERIT